MTSHIYLGLGTNMGDREKNLKDAIQALTPDVSVQDQSSVYQSRPWGYDLQPDFLNMAISALTALDPLNLLDYLKNIEIELGRQPSFLYGPRLIDIDILFYNGLVINNQRLTIPHPLLHKRAFTLVPLVEIAPDLVHPVLKRSVTDLLSDIDLTGLDRIPPMDG